MDDYEKEAEKLRKRQQLAVNKLQGDLAESTYVTDRTLKGHEVKRTGKGSDYEERKSYFLSRRKGPKKLVEVKSGGAKQSKLQKKTQKKAKKRGRGYTVMRY